MKRYLLFWMTDAEACGGWDDFHHSFDSLEEAIEETKNIDIIYNFHVVDSEKWKVIYRNPESYDI